MQVHLDKSALTHSEPWCRYTSSSPLVGYFLSVLAGLDAADKRRFLRFVTGSPALPPGGLAALQPRCISFLVVWLVSGRLNTVRPQDL